MGIRPVHGLSFLDVSIRQRCRRVKKRVVGLRWRCWWLHVLRFGRRRVVDHRRLKLKILSCARSITFTGLMNGVWLIGSGSDLIVGS